MNATLPNELKYFYFLIRIVMLVYLSLQFLIRDFEGLAEIITRIYPSLLGMAAERKFEHEKSLKKKETQTPEFAYR